MRQTAVITIILATLGAGAAQSAPMPKGLQGRWSDQPDCGKGARMMVFGANVVTILQGDGRRKSAQIDTTGDAATRLEVTVTKVLSGEKADPAGAHAGDRLVIRADGDTMRLLGHADAGKVLQETADGPVLHRCP